MQPMLKKGLLLAALAAGLSACVPVAVGPTVTVSVGRSNIITDFRPDRGEGASYRVGERVRFVFRAQQAGYLTLVSLDPDGYGSVLARNLYVPAGTTVLPRGSDGVTLDLAPPRGLQRVRAIFTTVRPTSDLVFSSGRYDRNGWNTTTDSYLRPYGERQRDVQETYFLIR